jgi:hypothetical protein
MRSGEQEFIAESADFLADAKVTVTMSKDPNIDLVYLHFQVVVNGRQYLAGRYPFMNYIKDFDPDDDGYNF